MKTEPIHLKYVVLRHEDVAEPHFDIMLETTVGGRLTSFRSPVWPLRDGTRLTPLDEHRRDYLTYEGPISGERGFVTRVHCGTFQWLSRDEVMRIRFDDGSSHEWTLSRAPAGHTLATRA